MNAAFHHAAVALRRASSVVLCGHVHPDGDALGSVLALTLALRSLGVPVVPTLADDRPASSIYDWLPGFALFSRAADLEPPAVFVALDTPVPARLGAAQGLAEAAGQVIVIDHHWDATEFGALNLIDRQAAATGQIVWRMLDQLGVTATSEIALCCYTALLTDTGRFQYQNTNAGVLRDAAAMLEAGVDPAEVARLVYQNRSKASLDLEARTMSRLTVANGGMVAYAWVTDEDFAATGALVEEAEYLPDAVRTLRGIEVALLLREHGDEVRVNLRAKTTFDVGAVARAFGGGGHTAAAGFTWKEPGIDSLLPKLLSMLPDGGGS